MPPAWDLGLAIERKVITELGHRDVGQEARARHAARNGKVRHRRLHHRFAFAARAGGTDVTDDLEAAGDVFQDLGDAFTDGA
jgi:hypothetical protein